MPESEESSPEEMENNSLEKEEDTFSDLPEADLSQEPEEEQNIKVENKVNTNNEIVLKEASLLAKESGEPATIQELSSQEGLGIEVNFVLDRQHLSLTKIRSLAEGEVLTLSGADFKAMLLLQEKAIAEAQLVMVEGRPSVQIKKVFKTVPLS